MLRHTTAALALLTGLAGCANMDPTAALSASASAFNALTLNDQQVIQLSDAACQKSDADAKIASANSAYAKRLNRIMADFGPVTLNGRQPTYQVYLTPDVNAWAMGNGCIRVYQGLMDMMNDDELRGIIGHEMGHVALGHSKNAMRTAYAASAVRTAAAGSGNSMVASLGQSGLAQLTENLVNAQFSQSQELAADDYAFDFLGRQGMNQRGLISAFEKLAQKDGGASSLLSSHPSSPERARRLQQRL